MTADPMKPNSVAADEGALAPTLLIGEVSAGDIVFVYDGSTSPVKRARRWINILGQRVLAAVRKTDRSRLKVEKQKYSHVMLGLGGGLIIHADGKTVAVEVVSDALHHDTKDASRFQIFRRKSLTAEQADAIVKPAMRYYNQRYSFFTYFQEIAAEDTTQFCSRLVTHSYGVAGMPLTSLPDNQVLPMDLYRICQSKEWEDVTASVFEEALSKHIDESIPPIDVPGKGQLSMSEFLAEGDALILKAAQLQKKQIAVQYDAMQQMLMSEALLAKAIGAKFGLLKPLWLHPEFMSEDDALRIGHVLKDLSSLLQISQLPEIDVLLKNTPLNTSADGSDKGQYAGNPAPSLIREMQLNQLRIRYYSDLILADIGLGTILGHTLPSEKFPAYREVKPEFAQQFLAALERIDNVSAYSNSDSLLTWVKQEHDRTEWRKVLARIVLELDLIASMRKTAEGK